MCCNERRNALLKRIAITSCQILISMDELTSRQRANIAAPGASNRRHFAYESHALINCAITARLTLRQISIVAEGGTITVLD